MAYSVGPRFLNKPRKKLPPPPARNGAHFIHAPRVEVVPEPVVEVVPEPAVEVVPEPVVEVVPEPVVEVVPEPVVEVVPEPEPVEKPKVSMLSSKAELIAAAESLGLKVDATMTKKALLAAIEAV